MVSAADPYCRNLGFLDQNVVFLVFIIPDDGQSPEIQQF
jgi:hypothetical protein